MDLPVQLIAQGIKRGSILLSDSFEDIDHSKFFVIIGVFQDKIAGFFFINSRIHPIIQSKSALFAMQYLLRKNDYDFLRYDSFLAANQLQTREIDTLVNSIKEGRTSIVGVLNDYDLNMVLEACRNSNLFTPKEKQQFFY